MQEEKPLIDDDICEILNEKEILDSDSEWINKDYLIFILIYFNKI